MENTNPVKYKRQCQTKHSGVLFNDKEAERRAKNRKYQRNYCARLRVKADGNQKEHHDPGVIITKQPGSIKNNVTTKK